MTIARLYTAAAKQRYNEGRGDGEATGDGEGVGMVEAGNNTIRCSSGTKS